MNWKNQTILACLLATLGMNAVAELAQKPLVNKISKATPNLTLILDTSGSMDNDYIYENGPESSNGEGLQGPNDKTYAAFSPDVNLMHYDPRIRYTRRVNYLGANLSLPSLSTTNWKVYFRVGSGAYGAADLSSPADFTATTNADLLSTSLISAYPSVDVAANIALASSKRTKFPRYKNRDDCSSKYYCTFNEERLNYSIWERWYSTRGKMMQTVMGQTFQELTSGTLRLAYGSLSQLGSASSPKLQAGMDLFTELTNSKKDFFTWLYGVNFTGGTPILKAVNNVGKYHERSDNKGPWGTSPDPTSTSISSVGAANKNHLFCRRSFAMVVTDGYYTDKHADVQTDANLNFDGREFAIDTFIYNPKEETEYREDKYNMTTLADLAMYYWGRDLRPDVINMEKSSDTSNPSTWQNMMLYGVTLGLEGKLPQTQQQIKSIQNETATWPEPVSGTRTTVDDLWHATVNARGDLFNARNPGELKSKLLELLKKINTDANPLAGVALSGNGVISKHQNLEVIKYRPEYFISDDGNWQGNLHAIKLNGNTYNDTTPIKWSVEKGGNSDGTSISTIPDFGIRKVFTWNKLIQKGMEFTAKNTQLNADLVNYIKGDASKEERNGGSYRNRVTKLGDIVNSTPAIAYDSAGKDKAIFVGANDGMLHGFDAETGKEIFAYVPQSLWPKLNILTENFSDANPHRYFVDGPVAINKEITFTGDHSTIRDSSSKELYKSILTGTTGAGAKTIFALDVTQTTDIDGDNILWEVSNTDSNYNNLGHILSTVSTGHLNTATGYANVNGKPLAVAIFGNGYDSNTGYASLFISDLATGAVLKEIVVDNTGNNALGAVELVRDEHQNIVGAYAGDLKGNLWKFNFAAGLKTAELPEVNKESIYRGLLYTAAANQPITAVPAVIPHPNGGYMVVFGTGKLMENSDAKSSNIPQQSVYGIWDKIQFGTDKLPLLHAAKKDDLVRQSIAPAIVDGELSDKWFTISSNPVDIGDGETGIRGWFIDLPNTAPTLGQRVIHPVQHIFQWPGTTTVKIDTMSPFSSGKIDDCTSANNGTSWWYFVDGLTGQGATLPITDTNGDGFINGSDNIISGATLGNIVSPTVIQPYPDSGLNAHGCVASAANSCPEVEICNTLGRNCKKEPVIRREWRQLFLR